MFTQPVVVLVPVIVYVVVVVGLATGLTQAVQLNAVLGDQVYVFAPLAVNVVLEPTHIVGDEGETLSVGNEFTVTVTVFVFTQPVTVLVPVTV